MKLSIALIMLLPQLLFASVNSEIYGNWTAENALWDRGVEFQLSFLFRPNYTALTVDCFFNDGAHLQASANSFASYYRNEISIQERKQTVSEDGFHFCRATLMPATWNVYFDQMGRMVLFMPIPYQARFNLVRFYTKN